MEPDWTEIYRNHDEFTFDLNGLQWQGFGWYLTGDDVLLALPSFNDTIRILVYNGRDPRIELRKVLELPEFIQNWRVKE